MADNVASTETTGQEGPQRNITESHVKATLKADKGSGAQLTSWSVEDFTQKGDNYASVVTSVSVKFSLNGHDQNTSYVVKLKPSFAVEDFNEFGLVIFKKEAEFFEEIFPALNTELTALGLHELRMAKWFHSSLEEAREMIFLEDLRSRGFKMADRKKGLDVPHTTLALQELARMHAASLMLQARTPDQDLSEIFKTIKTNWISPSFTGPMFESLVVNGFSMGERMIHAVEGYEGAKQWLARIKDDCVGVIKSHLIRNAKFDVLCHGDCWVNNMLFRYNEEGDPVEVMLLDLQICRMASPATDLNYLLYTSLHGNDRKAHVQDFLASYYDSFTRVMEAGGKAMPFTLQDLHREYMNKMDFGVLSSLMSIPFTMAQSSDIPDMQNLNEEDMETIRDNWEKTATAAMDTPSDFRSRFLGIFGEVNERGTAS